MIINLIIYTMLLSILQIVNRVAKSVKCLTSSSIQLMTLNLMKEILCKFITVAAKTILNSSNLRAVQWNRGF